MYSSEQFSLRAKLPHDVSVCTLPLCHICLYKHGQYSTAQSVDRGLLALQLHVANCAQKQKHLYRTKHNTYNRYGGRGTAVGTHLLHLQHGRSIPHRTYIACETPSHSSLLYFSPSQHPSHHRMHPRSPCLRITELLGQPPLLALHPSIPPPLPPLHRGEETG